jgi:HD-GYP domain-containing protein (c-di-GMP phosphodiesterase class II)
MGKRAPELPLLKSILAKGGEGTEEDIGLDGLRRIFGFVPLHRTASGQAYLWVAIPKDVVVGPAEHALGVRVLVVLALTVLTFWAVWLSTEVLLSRRAAAVIRAANELGKGNLAARVGLKASGDEIGQLAQSFDRMADSYQHHEEILRRSLEDSIQALSGTEAMRDPYMAGHQKRVAELAVAIAGELGLPKDEIRGIELAASVHDLGKMQVPAAILSKQGKLADAEFALFKTHAQAGYDILKDIVFPWPIATMVWQHHERLDGSGYPQGLKGAQILLGARIIAVANVVEDMASDKPYRPALGIDAALAKMETGRGTAFDPEVVDACLKLFREGRFTFQE